MPFILKEREIPKRIVRSRWMTSPYQNREVGLHRRTDGHCRCVLVCVYALRFRVPGCGEICHRTRCNRHYVREPSCAAIRLHRSVRSDSPALQSGPPNIRSFRKRTDSPCECASIRRVTRLDERPDSEGRRYGRSHVGAWLIRVEKALETELITRNGAA
jgi:hypothetical protein